LNGSPRSDLDFGIERFSRKVFVGGLPPDIDEGIKSFNLSKVNLMLPGSS
jgi:hypothetical protein